MKHKRTYQKPTVQVVELNASVALLNSSATLQGYQYEQNGWEEVTP